MVSEILRAIAASVLIALAVAGVLTGAYLHDFKGDCERSGGTFSMTVTVANCRY